MALSMRILRNYFTDQLPSSLRHDVRPSFDLHTPVLSRASVFAKMFLFAHLALFFNVFSVALAAIPCPSRIKIDSASLSGNGCPNADNIELLQPIFSRDRTVCTSLSHRIWYKNYADVVRSRASRFSSPHSTPPLGRVSAAVTARRTAPWTFTLSTQVTPNSA